MNFDIVPLAPHIKPFPVILDAPQFKFFGQLDVIQFAQQGGKYMLPKIIKRILDVQAALGSEWIQIFQKRHVDHVDRGIVQITRRIGIFF